LCSSANESSWLTSYCKNSAYGIVITNITFASSADMLGDEELELLDKGELD